MGTLGNPGHVPLGSSGLPGCPRAGLSPCRQVSSPEAWRLLRTEGWAAAPSLSSRISRVSVLLSRFHCLLRL